MTKQSQSYTIKFYYRYKKDNGELNPLNERYWATSVDIPGTGEDEKRKTKKVDFKSGYQRIQISGESYEIAEQKLREHAAELLNIPKDIIVRSGEFFDVPENIKVDVS